MRVGDCGTFLLLNQQNNGSKLCLSICCLFCANIRFKNFLYTRSRAKPDFNLGVGKVDTGQVKRRKRVSRGALGAKMGEVSPSPPG